MLRNLTTSAALIIASCCASVAMAGQVYITEFNSNSGDGGLFEYVEITNTGNTPVNMSGWSQDDSTRTPNKTNHGLSGFGTLAPHESAIITEANPDSFRTYWWGSVGAAPAGLKIVGPYTNDNLSSSGDEVNLYDNTAALVDRLTYNAGNGGTGNGVARNAPQAALGLNSNSLWANATVGDTFHSFRAAGNSALIGSPGYYPAPEPSSVVLGVMGAGLLGLVIRRRRAA